MSDLKQSIQRRCPTCRRANRSRVRLPEFTSEYFHDGRIHAVTVRDLDVWQCTDPVCSAIVLDDRAQELIDNACRDQLGLLQPDEIRKQRENLRMTQSDLAEILDMPQEVVARLETGGQIQQREMDTLLRLFFKLPEVRAELGSRSRSLSNGKNRSAEKLTEVGMA